MKTRLNSLSLKQLSVVLIRRIPAHSQRRLEAYIKKAFGLQL